MSKENIKILEKPVKYCTVCSVQLTATHILLLYSTSVVTVVLVSDCFPLLCCLYDECNCSSSSSSSSSTVVVVVVAVVVL